MYTTKQMSEAARRSAQCWENLRVELLSVAYAGNGRVRDESARQAVFDCDRQYRNALARANRLAFA